MKYPEQVLKRANQDMGEQTKNRYLKSWDNPKSRKDAIAAKCCDCMGFEEVVPRIKDCNIVACPLHKVRPFTDDTLNDV
jgi:hypothetical protein